MDTNVETFAEDIGARDLFNIGEDIGRGTRYIFTYENHTYYGWAPMAAYLAGVAAATGRANRLSPVAQSTVDQARAELDADDYEEARAKGMGDAARPLVRDRLTV